MADELTTPTDPVEEKAAPSVPLPDLIPLDEKGMSRWKDRIEKARARQKLIHPWWQECRDDYVPKFSENPKQYHTRLRTNRNYKNVHRKAADLVYQRPEMTIEPSPLLDTPEQMSMVATHAEIVNAKIGRNGANIKWVAHAAACDWLIYGSGGTKIGYHSYFTPLEEPDVDPVTGQPLIDVHGAPKMRVVPVPIPGASHCFIEHISPKSWLIPHNWRSTDFDKSPWLAWQFSMPRAEAIRRWGNRIPKELQKGSSVAWDTLHFDDGLGHDQSGDEVTGVEIWYLSHLERVDRPHPQHMTVLVLIDGATDPVEHRDSPFQTLDNRGALTPDSLIGNPIHPFLVRTMTDSAYVQSDVAVALPQTHELDTHREQGSRQREITTQRFFYNKEKLSPTDLDDALSAAQGGAIGVSEAVFTDPAGIFKAMPESRIPPDNYQQQAMIDNDLSQTWGIDANTSGVSSGGSQTATETGYIQANVGARMGWDQGVFTDCLIAAITKYATLLARFLDVEDAANIVGMERAQQWKQWVAALPVRLAFSMVPDSSLRNDTPLDRKQWMDLYTYISREPLANRAYFLQRLFLKWHVDPSRALLAQPPSEQPKMEPPSFSVNGDDLGKPQAPIIAEMLRHYGIPISPEAVAMTGRLIEAAQMMEMQAKIAERAPQQPEHGGKAPQMESLDKHQADETGAMQNTGLLNPSMAGGIQ